MLVQVTDTIEILKKKDLPCKIHLSPMSTLGDIQKDS